MGDLLQVSFFTRGKNIHMLLLGPSSHFFLPSLSTKSLGALFGGGGGLVAKSCPTLATPWTVAYKAAVSMGFPSQEY